MPQEGPHRRDPHVAARHDVAHQRELVDQRVGPAARRALHVGRVGRVEAERGGGGPVRHEVDPEEVKRAEDLRWGDVGRCGEMWGDVERCGEMWGDVGRCGEIQGSAALHSSS